MSGRRCRLPYRIREVVGSRYVAALFYVAALLNRTGSVVTSMLAHASFNTANGVLLPAPGGQQLGSTYATVSLCQTANVLQRPGGFLVYAPRGGPGSSTDEHPATPSTRVPLRGPVEERQLGQIDPCDDQPNEAGKGDPAERVGKRVSMSPERDSEGPRCPSARRANLRCRPSS